MQERVVHALKSKNEIRYLQVLQISEPVERPGRQVNYVVETQVPAIVTTQKGG